MDTVLAAVIVYGGSLLVMVLLCLAARRGTRQEIPQADFGIQFMDGWEILSYMAMWTLIISLVFCGAVDVMIWAVKSRSPSVSNLIHYHLQLYPWIGWVAAGLAYHLLVDRPAPPWR
jgi:hypothetical protein